jgi:Fe-S-cluster containining protein
MANPCIACGACCAHFRVSFHWSEADDAGGTVPVDRTVDVDSFRRAMRGTDRTPPRCSALEGDVGCSVRCAIYEQRPSVCREFAVSWEDGGANEKCDKARGAAGLGPIPPAPFLAREGGA